MLFCKAKQIENKTQFMETITEFESRLSLSPSPELDKERQNLQMNYNLLPTQETEKLLLRLCGFLMSIVRRQDVFCHTKLRVNPASQQIKQIRTPSGELPPVINETFKIFYSELYTSQSPADDTDMIRFLDNLEFPPITPIHVNEMDQHLKPSEIADLIKLIQSGKAPGPDGYPIKFYKKILIN